MGDRAVNGGRDDDVSLKPYMNSVLSEQRPSLSPTPSSSDVNDTPPSRPESPPPEAATEPPKPKTYRPLSPPVLALLFPAAIFGLLARLGIRDLFTYDGESIFPLAWVQGLGCFVMGIVLGLREPLSLYYAPYYTMLTTGFCGSLTTFSAWQEDVFLAFSNASGFHRGWFRDALDGLNRTAFTIIISLSCLSAGLHLSTLILPHIPPDPARYRPSVPTRKILMAVSVASYIITIPLYFKLSPSFRPLATAALLFSVPGTLLRHFLAVKLNPIRPSLPLGTLAANLIATVLLAMFYVLQRLPNSPSPNACLILQGLIDGFCGCLSTISTFAVEVRGLKSGKGSRYAAISWVLGQLLMVLVLGSAWWSGAIKVNAMCTTL